MKIQGYLVSHAMADDEFMWRKPPRDQCLSAKALILKQDADKQIKQLTDQITALEGLYGRISRT